MHRYLTISVLAFAFLTSEAQAEPKMTKFDPAKHGFNFRNDFKNDFIPGLDVTTGGLCNGMSCTALDYYFAGKLIPQQDFRPANRTKLQSHLYERNVTSIKVNLDRWADIGFNPLGSRDTELFERGLKGELAVLRSYIDKGTPVPLGLQMHGKSGNHAVVAIGYDVGNNQGDLKIFLYDPNYPNETKTLVPNLAKKLYTFPDAKDTTWRTYFVDTRYKALSPPNIPNSSYPKDGKVHELVLKFSTGQDDLRGGNDNVNVTVHLADGSKQTYANVNLGARWLSNYTEYAQVILSKPIAPEQIKSLVVATTFTGGIAGDNWDMQALTIRAIGGNVDRNLQVVGANRFTGDKKSLTIPIGAGGSSLPKDAVTKLILQIRTGGDDLRGGNDNLNVEIHFKNGTTQTALNVNKGQRWADNSTASVPITLSKPVPVGDIKSVTLKTTFGGGVGGDNWNMDWIRIRAFGPSIDTQIADADKYRFTGQKKTLTVNVK